MLGLVQATMHGGGTPCMPSFLYTITDNIRGLMGLVGGLTQARRWHSALGVSRAGLTFHSRRADHTSSDISSDIV